MKLSKKYKRIGWALVAVSIIGSLLTTVAFGHHEDARQLGEKVADFLTGMLIGAGVWYWGKGDAAEEFGA